MRIIQADELTTLEIARVDEQEATQVRFGTDWWYQTFGDGGSFALEVQRPTDAAPYLVPLTVLGDAVAWTVSATDAAILGRGSCQLRYYVGETLAKARIWTTRVLASLSEPGEPPPEPWESYVDAVHADAVAAEASAQAAETSAGAAAASADAAETLVNGARSIVMQAFPHESAVGAEISFDDGAPGVPLASLAISFAAAQSGEGDPGLDNVRPISGFQGLTVTVKASQAAQGVAYAVAFGEAGTVYGGVLSDNGDDTWTLRVTHAFAAFDGSEPWEEGGTGANRHNYFVLRLPQSTNGIIRDSAICSHALDNPSISQQNTQLGFRVYLPGSSPSVLLRLFLDQSMEDFVAYLAAQHAAGTPVQIAYELAETERQTFTLSAESVRTLLGDNYVATDVGSMAATWCADPNLYVQKQIGAAVLGAMEEAY